MKKLTVKDIAKIAGVSVTAVSFVLNGKPGVSEATRKHIQEVIDDNDFKPNLNSKKLVLKKVLTFVLYGVKNTFPAGVEVVLKPGQSITLTPGLFHRFWGEKDKGTVLVREVSMCNDDANDNCFYDKAGRFPEIEEDEKPLFLLCNEY